MRVPKTQQKAERLLGKIYDTYPQLLASDTITQTDTLYLPETTIDTVFDYVSDEPHVLKDPVTGTKVTVSVDTTRKKLNVKLDQSPIKIRERKTINNKTVIRIPVEHWPWWVKPLLWYAAIVTVFAVILFLIRR